MKIEETDNHMLKNDKKINNVRIVDFKMPFFSMVTFMLKWALATIPAFFIIVFVLIVFAKILWNILF